MPAVPTSEPSMLELALPDSTWCAVFMWRRKPYLRARYKYRAIEPDIRSVGNDFATYNALQGPKENNQA